MDDDQADGISDDLLTFQTQSRSAGLLVDVTRPSIQPHSPLPGYVTVLGAWYPTFNRLAFG